MWNPFKSKYEDNGIVTAKCNEHSKLLKSVYRIEGENLAIITLLSVVLVVVLTKVI